MRGLACGAVAGVSQVALMYIIDPLLGLRPLPELLSDAVLAAIPGVIFGFLIDALQHSGKVAEEFGLVVGVIAALSALGALWGLANHLRQARYWAPAFSVLGWMIVTLVLLPISGVGFFGLGESLYTPVIWAGLFILYAVLLEIGRGNQELRSSSDAGRRRMLGVVSFGVVIVSLGALGLKLLPRWYQTTLNAPEARLTGPLPEVTPVENFYVVSKNFTDPVIDPRKWTLDIRGLVDRRLKLSLFDLYDMHSATEWVTMECVSNKVGGDLISTGSFTGVPLRDLLDAAGPRPRASWVTFITRDGYGESLMLTSIQESPEILVAYGLNGSPLPIAHGFPARLVVPGRYGMKSPKWLDSIEVVDHEVRGFWEREGWDRDAVVKTTARIDVPTYGATLNVDFVRLSGVAFGGNRGISKVEYSADGGATWTQAQLRPPLSSLAWVLWESRWLPPKEGKYVLKVRATDGIHQLQDAELASSYPNGASGYDSIPVVVKP